MIIKKPYAFLIKKFRYIHAILFVMLLYLAFKSFEIYSFFSEYVNSSYYINIANLTTKYINKAMFIVDLFAILFSGLILYILSLKKKERKVYLFICIYYIILIIGFIYCYQVFKSLQHISLTLEIIRSMRDISLLIILPQIVFLFIILSRTLGFNIKQFDFKKDLEEMQIDTSDYEEVEITLGKNNYKKVRSLRKLLRYTKYFILEHKLLVTIISSIIVLSLSLVMFSRLKVYMISYRQNEEILANSLWYTAQEAYITNTNINGKIITKDKYYLLAKVNIKNKSYNDYVLKRDTFILKINDKEIIPKFNFTNEFIDLGEVFTPINIPSGVEKQFLVVFELSKKEIKKEYTIAIKNFENNSIIINDSSYKEITIYPIDLNSKNNVGTYYIPSTINFEKTVIGNSELKILDYEIEKSFKEKYDFCVSNDKCYETTYIVKPYSINSNEDLILKLNTNIKMDETAYINKYIDSPSDLYKYYSIIKYTYQGVTKTYYPTIIDNQYNKNDFVYIEVPNEIKYSTNLELILSIRGIKYTIFLK